MILVDTSVWVQHLRQGEPALAAHLDAEEVLAHPLVVGEIAMGNLRGRATVLDALGALPRALAATDDEVMDFIEQERLHGLGIGYVDAHLLASVRLTTGARLWTLDRRLADIAARMNIV